MHSAQARRERELRQLVMEGVPLRTLGKSGHWILGGLHIFTQSGRWFSETTGKRGRLYGRSMRQIIDSEYPRRVEQLCPEIADNTRRMQLLYSRYDAFIRRARKYPE